MLLRHSLQRVSHSGGLSNSVLLRTVVPRVSQHQHVMLLTQYEVCHFLGRLRKCVWLLLFSGCTQAGCAVHTLSKGLAMPRVGRERYEVLRYLALTTQSANEHGAAAVAGIPGCLSVMR